MTESNPSIAADDNFKRSRTASIVKSYGLNKCYVNFIYVLVFITNLIINIDHGILPAAISTIKASLEINDGQIGTLGSLVYFGLTIGSFLSTPMF